MYMTYKVSILNENGIRQTKKSGLTPNFFMGYVFMSAKVLQKNRIFSATAIRHKLLY